MRTTMRISRLLPLSCGSVITRGREGTRRERTTSLQLRAASRCWRDHHRRPFFALPASPAGARDAGVADNAKMVAMLRGEW